MSTLQEMRIDDLEERVDKLETFIRNASEAIVAEEGVTLSYYISLHGELSIDELNNFIRLEHEITGE